MKLSQAFRAQLIREVGAEIERRGVGHVILNVNEYQLYWAASGGSSGCVRISALGDRPGCVFFSFGESFVRYRRFYAPTENQQNGVTVPIEDAIKAIPSVVQAIVNIRDGVDESLPTGRIETRSTPY